MERSDDAVAFTVVLHGEGAAEVRRFELAEALDRPYLASIEVALEGEVSPDELLGQDVVVTWARPGLERRLCGIVRGVATLATPPGITRVRLEVVPALALLALRRDTRIFQEESAVEILEKVLNEALAPYGRSVTLELSGEYPTREFCLQYQESDLDFVHRLLQEEGIAYCFDHDGEIEQLLLRDSNAAYPRVAAASDPIVFQPHDLINAGEEAVHELRRVHTTTATAIALRDHDWTKPAPLIEASAGDVDARGRRRERYEHGWGRSLTISAYDAGARQYGEHDAERQAAIRLGAETARAILSRGRGSVIGFAPGRTFEISGHPTVGADGEYLLTRVLHTACAPDEREDEPSAGALTYGNELECIPLDVEYRPVRGATKPAIAGMQTATVTGPAGEEIHTDEHGRVKVLFHWDRHGAADEKSSCWIRVQQKWAGPGWGFWWLPRVGMEVVVQFVDGDPDRPLVTGAVYNGNNALPLAQPDEKTKSTIKSNSTPGGGGSNELRFEDRAGSEEIYTHAQKDYNEVVENDHTTLVHHDQTNTVDNDQTQTVHNNQTEDVGNDQVMTVDGDRDVHVEGSYDETVDGTETRAVTGDVKETFSANEVRKVAADLSETIAASETRTIGGNQTETISASHTQTIGAASDLTVSGALTETVAGGITLQTPASWTVNATAGMTIVAPAGIKLDAAGGWNISAPGGVTQIDSERDWTGYFWRAKGAFARGITGAKLDSFMMTATYVHSKVGLTGIAMPQLGLAVEMEKLQDGSVGASVTFGGVDISANGAKVDN